MAELKTDFNVAPYYDDYNEDKQYYRILFRPATAVQARELTQLQTMMQRQVARFGNSIYKDGSIIEGVGFKTNPDISQIKFQDVSNTIFTNMALGTSESNNYLLVSNTTGLRATIFKAFEGTEPSYPDTNRAYVKYINTGSSANVSYSQFIVSASEQIDVYDTTQSALGTLSASKKVGVLNTLLSNTTANGLGTGYGIKVGSGIIYQKGFFLKTLPQNIMITEHGANVSSYIVGFSTEEYIIAPTSDSSLYDNSIGSTNYNAPGAHRLKLVPTAVAYDTANAEITVPEGFLPILEFDGGDGHIVEKNRDPQFSTLGDQLAKRTSEESGDYVIKPFQISTTSSGNTDAFFYKTTSGIAYVDGYRVEFLSGRNTLAPRATTTDWLNNQVATANFGSYVTINEFTGTLDTQSNIQIALYNAAQQIISTNPTASSPTGTLVGYANARAVVFESGTKGLSTATYLLYLFNIRMETNYSFANDVKSFYVSGTYGKVFGDIVLTSSKAILQEATTAIPLFSTGLQAVKRLSSNTGAYDTSYYYRTAVSPVSLGITGQATFGTPGPDTWAYGVGFLGATDQDELHVTFAQNTYSANLITNGTTNASSNSTHSTISSVTLFTGFGQVDYTTPVGSLVAVTNSTSTFIRRVTEVPGANSIIVTPNTTNSQTGLIVKKFFREGQPVDFSGTGNTAEVLSTTSLRINLALTPDSAAYNLNAQILHNRSVNTFQANKDVKKDRYVKIDCSTGGITGPWNLGLTDTFNLKAVYFGTTYANTNTNKVDWFSLDDGQADTHYNHGKLVLKSKYKGNITSSTRLLVLLDHFSVNVDSTHAGFFSVDSYPIDNANTANTNSITTGEIPYYYSNKTNLSYDLRNVIDFRPYKTTTANTTTLVANATVNPVTSNTFTLMGTTSSKIIEPDTNFTYDVEYYLGRKDLIVLNKDGALTVKQGTPAINPILPAMGKAGLLIADSFVPPYPSLTNKEVEVNNRRDLAITTNIRTQRGYTMKDIGAIESRINRLEYYVVLNALEQDSKSLTIRDANGLDRFKNGIFADPFNDHNIGKTSDVEYSVAVDSSKSLMRPNFNELFVDFEVVNGGSNYKIADRLAMLNYNNEVFINQPYATTYRNTTESFYAWNGNIQLFPDYDGYESQTKAAPQTVTVDTTLGIQQLANLGVFKDISKKIDKAVIDKSVATQNNIKTTTTVTQTTTTTTIKDIGVTPQTLTTSIGDMVTDVSLLPYMRARQVAIVGSGFKPNTRLYPYFDNIAVSEYCAPAIPNTAYTDVDGDLDPDLVASLKETNSNKILNKNGAKNAELTTNEKGEIFIIFYLPDNTFRTGDRKFELVNTDNISAVGAVLTKGSAIYTASALATVTKNVSFAIIQPKVDFTTSVEEDIKITTTTNSVTLNPPQNNNSGGGGGTQWATANDGTRGPRDSLTVTPNGFGNQTYGQEQDSRAKSSGGCFFDPVGQTFEITTSSIDIPGMYITQIGVFFKKKSDTLGVSISICETIAGIPNSTRTLGTATLKSKNVGVNSAAPTTETVFTFPHPIMLQNGQTYAFYIAPEGANPDYEIWVAEVGGIDIVTGKSINQNLYAGVMVVSNNGTTWNTIQSQDIKFKMYRAKFSALSGNILLRPEKNDYITVDGFTRNGNATINVGDVVYVANSANVNQFYTNTSIAQCGFGVVDGFNEVDGTLILSNSNGRFRTANSVLKIFNVNNISNTAEIVAGNLVASANIVSIDNLKYHAIIPKFTLNEPSGSSITLNYKGTSNSTGYGTVAGNTYESKGNNLINRDILDYNDYERVIHSYSNEQLIGGYGANSSSTFNINLISTNEYISPVIDLTSKAALIIENLINNDVTNEDTRYGEADAKYISKNVVLADGQEAEDLEVYVSAYRPKGTDIKVYVKFLNGTDPDPFDQKTWTLMSYKDGGDLVFSSPQDKEDYREYKFGVPSTAPVATAAYLNSSSSPANILSYTTSSGIKYESYKTYCIKIIMLADNPARTPLLADVRAIALQA